MRSPASRQLPPGASRALADPYAERKTPWKSWLFLVLVIAAVVGAWPQGYFDRFLG